MRGDGRVFKRETRWYVDYYAPGPDGKARKVREVAGDSEREATLFLRKKTREVAEDRSGQKRYVPKDVRRTTVAMLLDNVEKDYALRNLKSKRSLAHHTRAVREAMGSRPVMSVGAQDIAAFVDQRKRDGMADATIDRELEFLRRAYSLAREAGTLDYVPRVPTLTKKNSNARQGFITREVFEAILAEIPDEDFRDALEWFWHTGMRPGEFCSLTWDSVDWPSKTLRLGAKDAKIGEGRVLPLAGPLGEVMERRRKRRTPATPLVFHSRARTMAARSGGFQYRLWKFWREACSAIGQPKLIPYDLRRVAVSNLIRAGVPYKIAMTISGHKTMDTFQRYLITPTDEVEAAILKTAAYVLAQTEAAKVGRVQNRSKQDGA